MGVSVGDHSARLRVHGPRRWEPALSFLMPTWKLGPAAPAASVALDYRLAAGGYHFGDAEGRYDRRNPIGPGVLRRDASRVGHPLRAPQVEAPGEALSDPFAEPEPRGFGPVPPFWMWRTRHLGPRDEAWRRERCPQMPEDLDYRFFQCAHPDLVVPQLRGDERVRLDGLVPGGGSVGFALPGVALVSHNAWRDGRRVTARMIQKSTNDAIKQLGETGETQKGTARLGDVIQKSIDVTVADPSVGRSSKLRLRKLSRIRMPINLCGQILRAQIVKRVQWTILRLTHRQSTMEKSFLEM